MIPKKTPNSSKASITSSSAVTNPVVQISPPFGNTLTHSGTIGGSTITSNTYFPTSTTTMLPAVRLDPESKNEVAMLLPWGKVVSIPHSELIKYIGEREIRDSNELVRTLWDRYQMAVKLIWSEDDEQEV